MPGLSLLGRRNLDHRKDRLRTGSDPREHQLLGVLFAGMFEVTEIKINLSGWEEYLPISDHETRSGADRLRNDTRG